MAAGVFAYGTAGAADVKIGVMDMGKVLSTSTAGKRAQNAIEQKMKSYQASFRKDETDLRTLKEEIEKKGSAWSDSVRKEKIMTFEKKGRDLAAKGEKANVEMKKVREQNVNPILKKLEGVVENLSNKEGYTVILPRNVVLYNTKAVDITDRVIADLNKAMP